MNSLSSNNFERLGAIDASRNENQNNIKLQKELDAIERITQYLYPARTRKKNATSLMEIPHFSTGGIIEVEQFRPPAIVVFSFGDNYYLEGIIKSANAQHTLFDSDLTPIRSTVDIEFGVIDTAPVSDRKTIQYPQNTNV